MNRSATLDARLSLAGVERRALRIARMALRDPVEAEDAVQDAMFRLVRHYGRRPEGEWRPLFYRILGNRITDMQRHYRVRRAVFAFWSGGVAWDALDPAAQQLLEGHKEGWSTLPPERQHAMADGASRWLSMNEADRTLARERFQRWQKFRDLTPEQQEALRDAYRRYKSLPAAQRDRLRERWEQMSPEERRRALTRRQGPKPGTVDKRPCPPC